MTGQPGNLVVDCSRSGLPDPEFADEFRKAAFAQLEKGDLEKAAALMQEAKDVLAASQESAETIVPLTDAELKQRAKDAQAHLERARAGKAAEIRAALTATDHWVVRALEEGGQLSKPRTEHRQKLRDLLAETGAAETGDALEAIVVPDPPKGG